MLPIFYWCYAQNVTSELKQGNKTFMAVVLVLLRINSVCNKSKNPPIIAGFN